jgi:transposase
MLPLDVEVYVATAPIDLRWSFDRLAEIARERLSRDPAAGALFVFFGKRSDRVKILFRDPTGLCLFYKRLDRGTFPRPVADREGEPVVVIDEAELTALLAGLDLPEGEHASKKSRRPRKPPMH